MKRYFLLVLALCCEASAQSVATAGNTVDSTTGAIISNNAANLSVVNVAYGPTTTVTLSYSQTATFSSDMVVINIWTQNPGTFDNSIVGSGGTTTRQLAVGQELWGRCYYIATYPTVTNSSSGSNYVKLATGANTQPAGPGAGTNKTITLTYTNPSSGGTVLAGVVNDAQPGLVMYTAPVAPGATYSQSITIAAGDTGSYHVVVVDRDAYFAANATVASHQHPVNGKLAFDFTGFVTNVGGAYTGADGVAAGQAVGVPSAGPPSTTTTPAQDMPIEATVNPRYRSTGGASFPGLVTAATAELAPTQATDSANANAITGALKDLQDALKTGSNAVDMSGTNAKIDVTNGLLTITNGKLDTVAANQFATTTQLTAIATATTTTNAKLDIANAKADTAAVAQAGTNTKLDTANALATTGNAIGSVTNTKLDAVVSAQAATNTKLDTIAANTSAATNVGVETRLDTANTHLSAVKDQAVKVGSFVDGTHANQTSYNNTSQVASMQSAAAAFGDGGSGFSASMFPSKTGKPLTTPAGGNAPGTLYSMVIGGKTIDVGFGALGTHVTSLQGDSLLRACRTLLLFAAVVWFVRSCGKTQQDYIVGLGAVDSGGANTGPENVIPLMSQTKQLAQAAAACTAIFVCVAVGVAVVDGYMTYAGVSLATLFTSSSSSFQPLASVWSMLDQYIPLAVITQLMIVSAAMPYILSPLYMAALTVIKFVKL